MRAAWRLVPVALSMAVTATGTAADFKSVGSNAAVLSSDGLSTRWTTARYPSLFQKHPTVVAATLHRDLAKDSDDATIVVARAAP